MDFDEDAVPSEELDDDAASLGRERRPNELAVFEPDPKEPSRQGLLYLTLELPFIPAHIVKLRVLP